MSQERLTLRKYLMGKGLEIGALQNPMDLSGLPLEVKYVDNHPIDELRKLYPELATQNLVNPDIVDDGHVLSKVEDNSQDFIIANHLIEHLANPVHAIVNWQKKLRPGGVIFLAVPDKRYTFDINRELTTTEHILNDFAINDDQRAPLDEQHYMEWAKFVNKLEGEALNARAKELMDMHYAIHFHVWTDETFKALLDKVLSLEGMELEIIDSAKTNPQEKEFIFILKKKGELKLNTQPKQSFFAKLFGKRN